MQIPESRAAGPLSAVEKAFSLCSLLGLAEAELDELLALGHGTEAAEVAADVAARPALVVREVATAYPETTVQALLLERSVRLPGGLPRSEVATAAARLRLLVRARDGLMKLAERCETASQETAAVLDRVALRVAPQLHAAVALDSDKAPAFRPLLQYHERRCLNKNGMIRFSAARVVGAGPLAGRGGA